MRQWFFSSGLGDYWHGLSWYYRSHHCCYRLRRCCYWRCCPTSGSCIASKGCFCYEFRYTGSSLVFRRLCHEEGLLKTIFASA